MKKIIIIIIFLIPFHLFAQDTLTIIYQRDTIKISQTKIIAEKASSDTTKNETLTSKLDIPKVKGAISFGKIMWAIIFIIIGYLIIRFITKSIEIWSEKKAERRVKGKAIIPIIKVLGWFFITFFVIKVIFNPSSQSLFAFSASIGVAVGFAAQDILKNIFAGFVILIDRPFKVGDKIEVNGTYGEVLDMSLRSTRVLTADDSVVSLPNGNLMNASISNSNSGELNCQVVAEIYLPITIDTTEVKKIALESAKISKYIYLAKPIYVLFFNEINQGKVVYKMRLKAYVLDTRFEFAFKSEMTENTINQLVKNGILDKNNTI